MRDILISNFSICIVLLELDHSGLCPKLAQSYLKLKQNIKKTYSQEKKRQKKKEEDKYFSLNIQINCTIPFLTDKRMFQTIVSLRLQFYLRGGNKFRHKDKMKHSYFRSCFATFNKMEVKIPLILALIVSFSSANGVRVAELKKQIHLFYYLISHL